MDNENHKNTWNNFTKFVLVGHCSSCANFSFNGFIFIIKINYDYSLNATEKLKN